MKRTGELLSENPHLRQWPILYFPKEKRLILCISTKNYILNGKICSGMEIEWEKERDPGGEREAGVGRLRQRRGDLALRRSRRASVAVSRTL